MTSDAKIGLLLGLVFIFVIAFVINGLPSLRPPISKAGATTNGYTTDEDFTGVTGKTERVPNWPDSLEPQRTSSETVQAPVEEPKPAVQEPRQTANNENVRSFLPLPPIKELLSHLTPTVQEGRAAADIDLGTRGSVTEPPAASTRPPMAAVPPVRPEPMPESRPAETLTKVEPRESPKPATAVSKPASIPGAIVYTVVSGDNLAVIAKKMYGPEEGNRVANIQRIFHANEAMLKSPDNVSIGQKLMVPPPLPKLSPTTSAPATPADILPPSLFEKPKTISEKVQSLGQRAPAATPAASSNARLYTVQSGDNLWKIAAGQLGSGTRWDEIAKLNPEILKRENSVDPGMKLRLPSK
jgi:nucleoid-associated protein YgaU